MALHLRQIEIRSGAATQRFARVVEEIQTEVHETRAGGVSTDGDVGLVQMPAARPNDQRRQLLAERVLLPFRRRETQ